MEPTNLSGIDGTRQYKTRLGSPVKVWSNRNPGIYTIMGAYWSGEEWVPATWRHTGRWGDGLGSPLDIVDYATN